MYRPTAQQQKKSFDSFHSRIQGALEREAYLDARIEKREQEEEAKRIEEETKRIKAEMPHIETKEPTMEEEEQRIKEEERLQVEEEAMAYEKMEAYEILERQGADIDFPLIETFETYVDRNED